MVNSCRENANFHPEEDEDVFEKVADDHPLSGLFLLLHILFGRFFNLISEFHDPRVQCRSGPCPPLPNRFQVHVGNTTWVVW